MSEMVDRIAATLYGGDLRDCYHPEMFRRQARKCIEAMREPTPKMVEAAQECFLTGDRRWALFEETIFVLQTAMIDAALKDA